MHADASIAGSDNWLYADGDKIEEAFEVVLDTRHHGWLALKSLSRGEYVEIIPAAADLSWVVRASGHHIVSDPPFNPPSNPPSHPPSHPPSNPPFNPRAGGETPLSHQRRRRCADTTDPTRGGEDKV
jgi:hypothetical protein